AVWDGALTQVVAEPRTPEPLRVAPAAGCTRPRGKAVDDRRIAPVPDDRLPAQTQPRLDEPELAVAVRRLVQVHEVHVDLAPREIAVELRVQVEQRLPESREPGDPHLRGRERVHPRDDADARRGGVRLAHHGQDRIGARRDALLDAANRNVLLRVERSGYLARMFLDQA